MTKQEIGEKYLQLDSFDKTLFAELLVCCEYMDSYDFNNLFKMGEISESEFFSIFDFLYHQDCFLMLFKLMAKHIDKIQFQELSFLEDVELNDCFNNKLDRIFKNYKKIFH